MGGPVTDQYAVRWRSAAQDREVFLSTAGISMQSDPRFNAYGLVWVDNADAELPALMGAAEAVAAIAALMADRRFARYADPGKGDYDVVRWLR